jgi:uncharacterized membrane protein YccC
MNLNNSKLKVVKKAYNVFAGVVFIFFISLVFMFKMSSFEGKWLLLLLGALILAFGGLLRAYPPLKPYSRIPFIIGGWFTIITILSYTLSIGG